MGSVRRKCEKSVGSMRSESERGNMKRSVNRV